jgi:tetratricopeptide (TPR) repeat protein
MFLRIRKSRLFQILIVYLGVSWLVLQVVGELRNLLLLPDWIGPVTLILLGVGLIIMLATAWVQSSPLIEAREQADEVPGSWELDVGDAVRALRSGRLPHLTWGRALVGGVVAFSLLFGVAGVYVLLRSEEPLFAPGTASAGVAPDGIAVLPFTVRGSGLDDWRESMVDLLSTGLDGAAGIRAISSRTVLARWRTDGTGDAEADAAIDVARRLGARYAVLGSAVAIGQQVRLSADVHEIRPNGSQRLGQAQEQGHPDSVLVLIDRLGMGVLGLVLDDARAGLPHIDLASVTTTSLPALKSYLDGEAAFRRGEFPAAIAAYERAVDLDSTFGLAFSRLAQAYGWNESVASARGREAGERALALIERLPARDALIVRATHHMRRNELEAVTLLEQAVERYPDDAEAWYRLGDAYYHMGSVLVGWEEVDAAFERAVALAPHVAPYRIHLLDGAFQRQADSVAVFRHLAELQRIAPASSQTRRYTLAAQIAFGDETLRDSAAAAVMSASLTEPGFGGTVARSLAHPRLLRVRENMSRTSIDEAPAVVRPFIAEDMAWGNLLGRGRTRDALEWFRNPALNAQVQSSRILTVWLIGLPVAETDVQRAIDIIQATGPEPFVAGAAAARRQHWDVHDQALRTLRTRADSLRAAGDSLEARQRAAEARLLEGYALWQRGRADEAVRVMEEARRETPHPLARWWPAMIHFDAGRHREAEPYLRSFQRHEADPLTAYYLGMVYEATDRVQQARTLYAFFVESWADADTELQPLVADARDRLVRLGPEF